MALSPSVREILKAFLYALLFVAPFFIGLALVAGCEVAINDKAPPPDKPPTPHGMACELVSGPVKPFKPWLWRCMNDEALCYVSSGDGMTCVWREVP